MCHKHIKSLCLRDGVHNPFHVSPFLKRPLLRGGIKLPAFASVSCTWYRTILFTPQMIRLSPLTQLYLRDRPRDPANSINRQHICPWPDVYLSLFIIISILNFNPAFFEILHICYRCLDPVPDGHEGKAKEETKGSSELSKPGLEGINQGLLLNQGVLGNGPEAEG